MNTQFKTFGIVLVTAALFTACSKEENGPQANGETYATTFKMTDAPTDNANVDAVMVTVSDVRVNGTSLEGFNKTTVELSALVNGSTQTLGNLDLAAGSYSNLELVLDYETDAAGNAPGCYVRLTDGTKDKIASTANSIRINDAFEVFAGAANEVVLDFDLRKTVVEESQATGSNFELVSAAGLQAAIRVVNTETTGMIEGTIDDSQNTSDKIIVYAYEKGTYNAETEAQGSGGVQFANAITSAAASGLQNSFSLHFLESGEYELVFASYSEDANGLTFNGTLNAQSATGVNLAAISVSAALQLSLNVSVSAN
ncbi:DUF4382 domain-containing protein [Robiginitalea sp. M366]|uniref:DUF4382 domain-containing protein n=1 Tax=Robiginitalea aestuariiviva TaxID=3036903 RepID=UPI00240E5FAE|nr:DUF4382 domain-containing protein [Robiginitalea aestuariiviva]MDG1571863.1 DUF4382 domain-containing protein [Robiginitalea aestuariiviva]